MNWAIQFAFAAALGVIASLGVTAAVTSADPGSGTGVAPSHVVMDTSNLPESQNIEDRRDEPPLIKVTVWRVGLYVYCETCGSSTDADGKPVDIYLYGGIVFGPSDGAEDQCHDYLAAPATAQFKKDLIPFLQDLVGKHATDPSFDVFIKCTSHEEHPPRED